ncbi:GTP-binding protein [Streptomyces sp. VRA16 Mangrove soil]|uniref:CobW family GTP-binding protein n=1 Tax=Streptomyces sp. VRA16 Mangrove soil TaxID=2817434 RepID=UPI001A9F7F1E|nr:GTP-binding protein [Streptomyces sp. VRA16 Mangrove soil]MBO1335761.1 GTP-binding protein [Streptomyces sp. VRA16 Mangrove soil]
MSKANPPQIPVVVLAGFLGSGKTTLLNHLLHRSGGTRIGAIVNDFGAIEIDAMAVAGQLGDSTVSLGNGCLCCAVDASELDVYLDKLTRPVNDVHAIDVIVIEASGIAEPQELVRMVLASENPRIVYGGLVEVVDAAEFDATREKHPEVTRHLGLADLVVVNKADRVDARERERVVAAVRAAAERAAVVTASYGRVDPEMLFDCRPGEERIGQLSFDDLHRHEDTDTDTGTGTGTGTDASAADDGTTHAGHAGHAGHLHDAYESVAFTSDTPMDPRRLLTFLDSRPEGLYRIKGYVDFGAADPRNRYAVHAVGRFLRFYPEPWPAGEAPLTQLVLIGAGVDTEALGEELTACKSDRKDDPHSDPPHAADEHSMWGVLRYVQEKGEEGAETADFPVV